VLMLSSALFLVPILGCGSGVAVPSDPGTPTGTSQFTVTATSGGTTAVQHTASLNVTVTP
jgi:hypothetical protein